MLGAIAGDIIGSIYERNNHKSKDFPLFTRDSTFTDDTVCSVAIADCLMNDPRMDFASYLRAYCNQVPHAGYGGMFKQWLQDETMGPYNSWGNGGAMRVSSVYFLEASSLNNLYEVVRATCYPTHNHEDAVSGATAIVIAMYLSSINCHIEEIRSALSEDFEYDLSLSVEDLQNMNLEFDVSARGSVPQALICALESTSYEDAIRNAISVGGDSDTIACMTGAVAEVIHGGVPNEIKKEAYLRLPSKYIEIIEQVYKIQNESIHCP